VKPEAGQALERYLPLLIDGDTPASMADLSPDALICDPLAGFIPGPILYSFLAARHMWLSAREARVEAVRTVANPGRVVVEQVLHLVVGGKPIPLPIALVGDLGDGDRLAQVRVYHSTYPLTGRHALRGPLLVPDEAIQLAPPVRGYHDALGQGQIERILATFAEDAVVREPSGGPHVHVGPDGRRAFYAKILATGGIELQHCTVTDDGAACALEYNCVRWGDRILPAQSGVAVYERATPAALRAARIYDDVDATAG